MPAETKIEWTDHSWSPWRGCTKVSPGCANCYAESLSERFNRKDSDLPTWGGWGKGKPRVLAKNWGDPVKWNKAADAEQEMRMAYGKGNPPYAKTSFTVFPSLCDWLDEEVPIEWLARFLKLIYDTPNLTWLLLTKRPENFRNRLLKSMAGNWADPLDLTDRIHAWIDGSRIPRNVWVGTSVEDQPRADERIPALIEIPAVGRFLSVEPMIGPVDLRLFSRAFGFPKHITADGRAIGMPQGIHWVIVGGESGPGARPCNVEWVRSIVNQCAGASVPCFVKQLGAHPVGRWTASPHESGLGEGWPAGLKVTHPKGGSPEEWPDDLRVRQFPEGIR